jgi:hypothetical protein
MQSVLAGAAPTKHFGRADVGRGVEEAIRKAGVIRAQARPLGVAAASGTAAIARGLPGSVTIGRRELLVALGGAAAAWPLAARAQQPDRMRRIGVLMPFAEDDLDAQANIAAFRQMLQMLGWTDSRNVRIDYRWGGGKPERIAAYARELVALKPDVILASSWYCSRCCRRPAAYQSYSHRLLIRSARERNSCTERNLSLRDAI